MQSFRPFRAYQQQATIEERRSRPLAAVDLYERALLMHPTDITSLERLALLAYRINDREKLERAIDNLLRVDLNNLNAYYLRALEARRSGTAATEFRNLQFISTELARRQPERPLLFSEDIVATRLRVLASGGANE
jgi:tetratricopeptide (TPR) repeat protein